MRSARINPYAALIQPFVPSGETSRYGTLAAGGFMSRGRELGAKQLAKKVTSLISRKVVSPFIRPALQAMLDMDARNIPRMRQMRALEKTVDYINEHMRTVQSFPDRLSLLEHALLQIKPGSEGLICEFGVYQGHSLNFIAAKVRQPIYGFDSFEGLPEPWMDGAPQGWFKVDSLPEVLSNVTLVKGRFDQTLSGFLATHPGEALFLHIDSDLYSSCKTVLEAFASRIRSGTVVAFDEYFNHPGWEHGEYKAWQECAEKYGWEYEFLGYTAQAQQVALKITSIGARSGSTVTGR
jgi:hypothetical protein